MRTQANTAVDFFIRNRGAMVEAALRLLEAGGCVQAYISPKL